VQPVWWQNAPMGMRERIQSVIDNTQGLSVRSVSLAAGMSDSMLNKFLRGQTDSMTIKTAEKLAEALGVDFIWLAKGEGDSSRGADVANQIERLSIEHQELVAQLVAQLGRTGTYG